MRTIVVIATLIALAATPVAAADFPGLPDQALFGICTAYGANEQGRENGNAENAAPFAWLADQADAEDETVEEFCSDVDRPGSDQRNTRGRP